MKNFRHEGRMISCTAPAGGVISGNGYKIGDLFGVAAVTAIEDDSFELAVEGVYRLPKAAEIIAEGAKVYWDTEASNVTTTDTDNTLIGHAVGAWAEGASEVDVRLSN